MPALLLPELFRIRSGETKCRLRRRLVSFLLLTIPFRLRRKSQLCCFRNCFVYARVKPNAAFGVAWFPSEL